MREDMKLVYKTLTFWVLVIFLVLMIAQLVPITGVILMMFGAPFWVGFMPHLVMLALIFDILVRKKPKLFLIIPILPYLAYYTLFVFELVDKKMLADELQSNNPSVIVSFDAEKHNLVFYEGFVNHYKVPVIYVQNSSFPQGFLSYRLVRKETCNQVEDNKENIRTMPVRWTQVLPYRSVRFDKLCVVRMPERPSKNVINVAQIGGYERDEKINRTAYKFYLDDDYLGEALSISYASLPMFPKFFIGCALNSSAPAWNCAARIIREKHKTLEPHRGGNFSKSIVASVLNIDKYTKEELDSFESYLENDMVFKELIDRKQNEKPEDFDKWGLRINGPYQPILGSKNGYPSFEGLVYDRNKGGPFKEFIKENENQIVYLDITAKPNARTYGFTNYGVCEAGKECNARTDNFYKFEYVQTSSKTSEQVGKFKGFFKVGPETLFENKYNKGDNDTRTILTYIPEHELDSK